MKLWTIQTPDVYELIQKEGVYRADKQLMMQEFVEAYNWIKDQMASRVGKPPDPKAYPVWAWYKRNGKHKKPDLREGGYAKRGEEMVLLEIEIPDNKVLLSDFDAWHFVLNNSYLDDSKSEEEWEANVKWYNKLPEGHNKIMLREQSWNRIFDIEPFENDWVRKGSWVQATFWELKKENIISVRHFTAK